jgi:hypothetical protein
MFARANEPTLADVLPLCGVLTLPLLDSYNLSPPELTPVSQPRYSIPMRRLDQMSKRP